jgi:two-component system alkaline phosphatase synthesis response regulator PhoP
MLVDDDESILKLLKMLLVLEGFEVTTALRGALGLELAQQTPPDLFMVDYHLNDMSALDFMVAVQNDAVLSQKPLVVVSGRDVEQRVLAAGATAFFLKPYDPTQLIADLRALLANS